MALAKVFRKVRRIYALWRIFIGNGKGFFEDFKYPLMLAVALKVYFPLASIIQLGLIVLFLMILFTLIGWIDLRFVRIAQTQAEISTGRYNPYFTKLRKSLNSSKGSVNHGK
jgi:hypothetical protein